MNRETIRKRINALRERTTARGCTEAEAMEAAAKVAELMREHGLSGDDLAMGEDVATAKASDARHRRQLWAVIANCTNTAALTRPGLENLQVIFVGQEPGPEIATYLVDVCHNAIAAEGDRFRKGDFYRGRRKASTKRKAMMDFTVSLVERLCHRLYALFADSRDQVRAAKAVVEFDRRYPNTASHRPSRKHKVSYQDAAQAGWQAGGRVHLGHGVKGGKSDPLRIGRD